MRRTWAAVVVVLAAGCGGNKALKVIKTTAALDLQCPARDIDVDRLSSDRSGATYRATGCGRTAQYDVEKKGKPVRVTEVSAALPPPVSAPAAPPPPPPAMGAPPAAVTQGAPAGTPCRFPSECSGGNCRMADGQNVCMGNGGPGAPCWFPGDCLNQDCRQKRCGGVVANAPPPPPPPMQGGSSGGSSSGRVDAKCCVNKQAYTCGSADAADRCGGRFARCTMGCMQSSSMSCMDQCATSPDTRPDPSGCQRNPSLDSSC